MMPGTVFLDKNGELIVQCGQGAVKLEKLQLEGKKELTAQEFLLGHKEIVKTTLR